MNSNEEFDPYSAPEANLGANTADEPYDDAPDDTPPYQLYSPGQVFGATFFGSILAGLWLLAENYRTLRMQSAFNNTLLYGGIGVIAVVAFAVFVPEDVPTSGISIGISVGMLVAAKNLQGEIFEEHQISGGQKHSNWRVAGIALAGFVVMMVTIIVGVFLFVPGF